MAQDNDLAYKLYSYIAHMHACPIKMLYFPPIHPLAKTKQVGNAVKALLTDFLSIAYTSVIEQFQISSSF